jgi:tRNA(fMet)-specific endonuclease VapC
LSPYLLDTNAWIEYLRGRSDPLRRRVSSHRPRDIRLCAVVIGELYHGAHKSSHKSHDLSLVDDLVSVFLSHSYDEAAAEAYGELRADLET